VSTWYFTALGLTACLLIGCASDPMKPPRPFGKRIPVNITPLPVISSTVPVEQEETIEKPGDSNDG